MESMNGTVQKLIKGDKPAKLISSMKYTITEDTYETEEGKKFMDIKKVFHDGSYITETDKQI